MWIAVTLEAIRELSVQSRIMRRLMATGTCQLTAVGPLVTIDTGQLVMLGQAGGQRFNLRGMARLAKICGQFPGKNNLAWRMRGTVAVQAVGIAHSRTMWFMAITALECFGMPLVTAVTVLFGVRTGEGVKGRDYLSMTSLTGGPGILGG